jgi:predicted enzyme related to lactoylglutathione lyase
MNAPSYFEIQVDDLQRAIAFYKSVFGWTFARAEGMPIEYWRIEMEGSRGGLLQRPAINN